MKKALWTLGGALLLTALLSAPAMARPFWQSDLVCTYPSPITPYAVILNPSGDLSVSIIYGLPPNTAFDCAIRCGSGGGNRVSCGTTDANGKLRQQRIAGFGDDLGADEVCAQVEFAVISQNVAWDGAFCLSGFVAY